MGTYIFNAHDKKPTLIRVVDILGHRVLSKSNIFLLYIYDDGTVEKRMIIK